MRQIKFRIYDPEQGGMCNVKYLNLDKVNCQDEIMPMMQFTGLLDKNGKEIYEGDIVDCTCELYSNFGKTPTGQFTTSHYEILWHEDCWAKKEIHNDRWTKAWCNYGMVNKNISVVCEKFFEIIGNIHENPELLK